MNYNGYKIICGDQFPIYRSTWADAYCDAMNYTMRTGKDAKIYGVDRIGCHLVKTCRKNAPRT